MVDADAVVLGLVGAGILLLGVAIASGRLWLLANYDPDAVANERRVGRLAGGGVVVVGLLTLGLAWGIATGGATDWWWAGWAILVLGMAAVVASVASGRL